MDKNYITLAVVKCAAIPQPVLVEFPGFEAKEGDIVTFRAADGMEINGTNEVLGCVAAECTCFQDSDSCAALTAMFGRAPLLGLSAYSRRYQRGHEPESL